jgi:tetratricopeptide (TPR) repeat protein
MFANKKVEHCWNLACGLGLPVAATTLAMASGMGAGAGVGAGAGAGALMLGVTGGLFGAAGGLWQNLYAEKRRKDLDEAESERDRIFNHDLAKAVAQSIATLLGPLADDVRFSKESRDALAALCKQSERVWLSMADEGKPVFAPLLEDELAHAVTVNPADPSLGAYGTPEMWKQVIAAMAAEAGPEVAEKLDSDQAARGEAVRVCHQHFARQFFNDLKHDFATKGQAFAAVHLRMMGELVTLAREQAKSSEQMHEKLDALTEAVGHRGEEVVAWIGEGGGDEAKGAQRLIRLRPLTSWLKRIDTKLAGIDRKADEMLSRLKKIEKQGRRTEGAVREGTSTTGKRVAAAHTHTRKRLGLLIGGGAALIVVTVLVTFAISSNRAGRTSDQAQTQYASIAAELTALKEILDQRRTLATTTPGVDGADTTTNPSFTDEDRAAAARADKSDNPLARALAAIIEGDTARARAELAKVTDPADRTADYYTALGDSYYFEQRFDEAVPQYALAKSVLGSKPTPKSLNNLANALAQAGKGDTAANAQRGIELYTQIIEMLEATPDWVAQALFNRGITHGQQGRPDEEIADYTRVIGMDNAPAEQVAKAFIGRGYTHGRQGRPDEAIADYTRVIGMDNAPAEQVANALVNRGYTHGQQGRPDEEIADYTRVIGMDNAPAEQVALALFNRGVTHHQQGRPGEAIADWTRVIGMDNAPADQVAKALVNRGYTHGQQGRPDEAIADYTRVIGMDNAPADQVAKALYNRGNTHGQQGRPGEAIADYTRVIGMDNAPAEQVAKALVNRGVTHRQQGRPDEAIADYTRVIGMDNAPAEQVAKALVNRGYAHEQSRPAEAIADYTRVIDLPDAPAEQVAMALVNRGYTHSQQGRPGEAIADYTRVIDLPDAPAEQVAKALINRGYTHGQQGRPGEEIADYTRAIDMDNAPAEEVALALVNRGVTHRQQGRPDEAIADYTRVIDLPEAPARQVANALFNRGILRKTTASTKAAACNDFARAARLYASLGMTDDQDDADQQRQRLGCDD